MELFTLPGEAEGVIRAIYSFMPPDFETEHMVRDAQGNMILDTKGDVLLGKMGFKLLNEQGTYDITKFALVEDTEYSPITGININMDGIFADSSHYEAQSPFRFTEGKEEADLNLTNITLSHTDKVEEVPDETTYKEYALTPTFAPETLEYEATILEYIDDIDLKATLSDVTSSMKVKVPKRDEEGKLVYEADGTTIVYEEKELTNDTKQNIKLNELGTQDTRITIIVTSADGTTTNEYQVTIKRPYGTIKGSIQLGAMLRESMYEGYGVEVKYIAEVKAYASGEFDWKTISSGEATFEEVDEIEMKGQVQTNAEDGSYIMYIIPGNYDLLIERLGFLPEIVTEIEINEGEEINLGNKILLEGDVDRNGIIDVMDMIEVVDRMDATEGDGIYEGKADFGQKGFIELMDLISVTDNMDKTMNIEKYM